MITYVTEHNEYKVEEIDGRNVIRHVETKLPHAIVGSYDPNKHRLAFSATQIYLNGKLVTGDELLRSIDSQVKVGSKLVAVLLDSEGRFSPPKTQNDLLLTSRVKEIRE
ncbi:hypothetical protein HY448_01835 [Candidatus Pacearchaeota archaeon]|nr:hypothetical protein [Candidatus Pacearchaeota archaeon]